ncbi:hypothetical protein L596_024855 [Steinernema carpocapsae]|uniref:Transmembrane protein n=1 Tax=Steinernema carpocapsae TaxID=34508 RepID=A0A4U5M6W0_STECR|nr:hypothetical protein L596_024855 [Steinernema carpocapsae]
MATAKQPMVPTVRETFIKQPKSEMASKSCLRPITPNYRPHSNDTLIIFSSSSYLLVLLFVALLYTPSFCCKAYKNSSKNSAVISH